MKWPVASGPFDDFDLLLFQILKSHTMPKAAEVGDTQQAVILICGINPRELASLRALVGSAQLNKLILSDRVRHEKSVQKVATLIATLTPTNTHEHP